MKATAVIKRPGEVKGVVGSPMSINANVSRIGGASVIVDPDLDPTSTNPVENKAITEAIEGVRDSIDALDEAVHDLDDDKQDVLTFDSVPTVNSQNPVTSGGVYSGLQYVMGELQDNVNALSGQIAEKYDASNPNGYISGISSSDVTAALGFTPYNATNPSGYVNASGAAAAAPVQSVNGQTGAVSLTIPVVPSNVSAFTNDAGYITLADLPIYNGGVS